ncbi:ferric reductase-like transmembrane domain-containing protein [Clostridium cadaveris]|nr:ferric reductase-like transmembrane domain-containing protein [Clostridium cadaveris]
MLFIITLLILLGLSCIFYKQINKYSSIIYLVSIIITTLLIFINKGNFSGYIPDFLRRNFLNIFTKGTFSLALFTIVMFTGVIKNTSPIKGRLMRIRGELSIVACILVLGHNILYGIKYFPALFINPSSLSTYKLMATIVSLIMITLMIPLMITSFKCVRKKMPYKKWKNIQRSAYVFYGLIYVHMMLLYIPKFEKKYLDIILCTVMFLIYFILRINKYFKDKSKKNKIYS